MVEYVYLPQDQIMIVDEEGLLTHRPLNITASKFVGRQIVGDVIMVSNKAMQDIPYELSEEK